jgi:hypothetical protein
VRRIADKIVVAGEQYIPTTAAISIGFHLYMVGFKNDSSSTGSVALLKTPSTISIISPPTSNNTNMPKPKVIIDKKKNLIMILSLTLGVVSLMCLVIAASIFFTYRRQVNMYALLSESEQLGFTEESSLSSFSFDELSKSTGGFSEEIGRGIIWSCLQR